MFRLPNDDASYQTCGRCRFWRERRGTSDGAGECRFHAPRPATADADLSGRFHALWPVTEETDWCGEWTPLGGSVSAVVPLREQSQDDDEATPF